MGANRQRLFPADRRLLSNFRPGHGCPQLLGKDWRCGLFELCRRRFLNQPDRRLLCDGFPVRQYGHRLFGSLFLGHTPAALPGPAALEGKKYKKIRCLRIRTWGSGPGVYWGSTCLPPVTPQMYRKTAAALLPLL